MKKQLLSKVETITPELAEKYLRHNTKNRPMRKNVVKYYASQMKKGQWLLNGESIIFNHDGTLEDGQHRLQAVIDSGVSVQMLVVRNAPKGSFATIDSGISRKVSDTFYINGIANATNVSSIINKYDKLCKGNIVVASSGRFQGASSISRQDILSIYESDASFWQEVCKFSSMCYKSLKLMSQTEIGAFVAFLLKQRNHSKEKVFEFFTDLLITDAPKSSMLAAYRKRLIKDRLSISQMNPTYKQQLFIKMWNYYIQGKEITCIRWNEEIEGKRELL